MLVEYKHILKLAEEGDYAIPAFNVYNMETVMGVIYAAEECNSPVILQVYPRLMKEETGYFLSPVILADAKHANVPVCFHLDHGPTELEVTRSIRYGATGIMLDGSAHDFDENVAITKKVVETCSYLGIGVEGELGHVGTTNDASMEEFTDPADAKVFVEKTGVTSLAVLVGNAHGRYKKPPKLDIDRVKAISDACGIPLVLHGGSGIPDEEIKKAIHCGIRKINFATDVCYAFLDSVRAMYDLPERVIAVDNFMKQPIQDTKEFCINKIRLCGAEGKA